MLTVTRSLSFDYGHRVLGHEGKCRFLHGHRGVAEIAVQAPELDSVGRVIDFGVLKTVVGGWIDRHFDHNLILNPDDSLADMWQRNPSDWNRVTVFGGKEPYIMPYDIGMGGSWGRNPTAENIARVLFDVCCELLPKEMKVVKVRVWETPNCYAEYIPSDFAITKAGQNTSQGE